MIVHRLQLQPFAGAKNRNLEFKQGLNVVLGDNEAGKSTLLQAILHVLFHKVRLTDSKQKEFSRRYFPSDGTDHAAVEIDFEAYGKRYHLMKFWSEGQNRQLRLSENAGSAYTTDEAVEKRMHELLGFSRATYEQVLFTDQHALSDTVKLLSEKKEVIYGFSDLLRSTVMEQAGVSSSVLQQKVELMVKSYFDHWDELADAPTKSKGTDKRWVQGVGVILSKYYLYQEKEEVYKAALSYEVTLDQLVLKINEQRAILKEAQAKLMELAPYEQDIMQRAQVLRELDQARIKEQKVRLAVKEWPELEFDVPKLKQLLSESQLRVSALSEEEQRVIQYLSKEKEREGYARAKALKPELEKLKTSLSSYDIDLPKDFQQLQRYEDRLAFLKNTAENTAVQLVSMKLSAEKSLRWIVKEGAIQKEIVLSPGESVVLQLKPGALLIFEGGQLQVNSSQGSESGDSTEDRIAKGQAMIDELLRKHDCTTSEALALKVNSFVGDKEQVQRMEAQFNALLGKKKWEQWEQEMQQEREAPSVRSLTQVSEDKQAVQQQYLSTDHQLKLKVERLQMYQQEFGQQDQLFDLVVEAGSQVKALELQLSKMKSLPLHYATDQEFMQALKLARANSEGAKDALIQLESERTLNESHAPQQDTNTLRQEMENVARALSRAKEEGRAYKTIQSKLHSLLEASKEEAFIPFQSQVQKYFGLLTNGKYGALKLDNDLLPEEIVAASGNLGLEHLSKGTNDALAISLRLGMAEHYLKERQGFLVLDDPFTDLDPERQQAAAHCLQEIAKAKQLIFFTCHPAMAKMLGGNLIQL